MHIRRAILAILAVAALALAACGGGGDGDDGDGGTDGGEVEQTTGPAPDSGTVTITAPVGSANTGFSLTEVAAPADTPFTIHFVNEDEGLPHNVQIYEGTDTSATPVYAPDGNELITGPAEADYEVPALPAGAYTFNCLAHPATMSGTLTVG